MSLRISRILLVSAIVLVFCGSMPCSAMAKEKAAAPATDQRPVKSEFVRFSEDGKGGGTLDTAIITYRNDAGVKVHLVAAVHFGEKSYYRDLNKTFDTYDAVLFEMVKPKGSAVPGPRAMSRPTTRGSQIRGATVIFGLQSFLRDTLKLEFQLDSIDYDRPNFIHADLDAETFNTMQEERGESLFGQMIRSIVQEMKRQAKGEGTQPITMFDILAAMKSPDSTRQYKLLLARQFKQMEQQIQGLEGEAGSVIVSERNKAALRVLEKTIAHDKKDIGVFYGAGHMRGIEDELVGKMGFKRTETEWRVAWEMRKK
jgi:hypothetical protein